jgi:hypothetical protein
MKKLVTATTGAVHTYRYGANPTLRRLEAAHLASRTPIGNMSNALETQELVYDKTAFDPSVMGYIFG